MTVELAAKLAFLRTPGALGDGGTVDYIETHMSCVFLTEHRVWKLKKPVRLPYLDYSTVERRLRSCEAELRLGRRLAADVYLDIVPLTEGAAGLALGGAGHGGGTIVDWVLVMRRLPADRMLPQMLTRGAATVADADAVADVLAAFYRRTPRAGWDGAGYRARVRTTVLATARELVERGAPRADVDDIVRTLLADLEREAGMLDVRVATGRVIDAHGDLRPEHVCLETPPAIIDPLEFDQELRTLDAVSELAFFALECDRLGAAWFGERVLARYAEQAGERLSPSLIGLYRSQHALTRALIALRHLEDAPASQYPRWRARGADYLDRARRRDPARAAR